MLKRFLLVGLVLLGQLGFVPATVQAVAPSPDRIISVSTGGEYADSGASSVSMSLDGRYVLFMSRALNLAGFGTRKNRYYVRDRQLGTTALVSTSPTNSDMTLPTTGVRLSGNGQYLYFVAGAKIVNPTDTDNRTYLFAKDLTTGAVTNIEKTYIGTPTYIGSNAGAGNYFASADGSKIVMGLRYSYGNGGSEYSIALINRSAAPGVPAVTFVTRNVQNAVGLGLSSDGSTVYYRTVQSGFNEPLIHTVNKYDVATQASSVVLSQLNGGNAFNIQVSATGRYIGFIGDASMLYPEFPAYCIADPAPIGNCQHLFRYDTTSSTLERVDVNADGSTPDRYHSPGSFAMSNDGNVFAWFSDMIMRSTRTYLPQNGAYSKHMDTGALHLVNVDSTGTPTEKGVNSSPIVLTADGADLMLMSAADLYGADQLCPEMLGEFFSGNQTACNNVYVLPTEPVDIADAQAPISISFAFDNSAILIDDSPSFIIRATDAGAGLAGAEYYLGDTDPGLGLATYIPASTRLAPGSIIGDHGIFERGYPGNLPGPLTPGPNTLHYRVYDKVGNWSATYAINFNVIDPATDTTAPQLGAPSWSVNPKALDETSTLTVPATDDLTGVEQGEYYLGATDPGLGNGNYMPRNGTALTADFGSDLAAGIYTVNVRAKDRAGNWSAVTATQLVVGLPQPAGLFAATPTNNAPVLAWNAVPGAATYQVWREDTLTGLNIQVSPAGLATTTFTDGYAPGVYNYTVVAVTAGGATSQPSAPFQVAVTNLGQSTTNARSLTAQGQSRVLPVYGADLLPGLTVGSTTKADFDFDLGYKSSGALNIRRALTATYNAGGSTFHVLSTSIDWLVISGTGNSIGTFQGLANVTLNNVTTTGLPFSVTAVDGPAAGANTPSSFKLTIYTDASRTTVLYRVSENLSSGKIKVN